MSKPETWNSWQGRVVDGKFPLRQYLGGSDHSAVFLTERPGTPAEKAAIKLIDARSLDADRELSRLRATANLSHHHLMRTIEIGRCQMDGGTVLFVVMENADDDLAKILPQRALEPTEVGDLLPPVIDALSYLHSKGFVHGRIKPSNVLAVGEQLKLSADNAHPAAGANSARRRIDAYDAPETAAGIALPEGDVWSVGAMLVAALTQNVELAQDGSDSKSSLPQNIPEPFRGIARECLHLDPKRRCSLAQIQARLQPSGRSVPAELEPASAAAAPVGKRPVFGVTLALIVVLGIVFAVMYSRGKRSEAPPTDTPPPAAAQPAPASPPASQPSAPATAPPTKANTPGEVLHQVLPEVPKSAQNTITGTIKVVVHVDVDPAGKVTSAKFKSSGSSRYFANQAMKAAGRWEFTAPQVNGAPQPSAWLLQFRFKRTSIQASPQQTKR